MQYNNIIEYELAFVIPFCPNVDSIDEHNLGISGQNTKG